MLFNLSEYVSRQNDVTLERRNHDIQDQKRFYLYEKLPFMKHIQAVAYTPTLKHMSTYYSLKKQK